jgi:hypothetical protein
VASIRTFYLGISLSASCALGRPAAAQEEIASDAIASKTAETETAAAAEATEPPAPSEETAGSAPTPPPARSDTRAPGAPETSASTAGSTPQSLPEPPYSSSPPAASEPVAETSSSGPGSEAPPVPAPKRKLVTGARDLNVRFSVGRVIASFAYGKWDDGVEWEGDGLESFLYIWSNLNLEFLPISYFGVEAFVQFTAYRKDTSHYIEKRLGFSGHFCLSGALLVTGHPLKEHWFDPFAGVGVKLATYWHHFDDKIKVFSPGPVVKVGGNFFIGRHFFLGMNYEFSYNRFDEITHTSTESSVSSTPTMTTYTETTETTSFPGFRLIDHRIIMYMGFSS